MKYNIRGQRSTGVQGILQVAGPTSGFLSQRRLGRCGKKDEMVRGILVESSAGKGNSCYTARTAILW
jgi:hypothetical protein